jgi:CheY-like chemotaxis protein
MILPCSREDENTAARCFRSEEQPMTGETILVVEDNALNMELICDLLRSKGYHIIEATTGEQALELVKVHHPRLVLMDVQLPELDGLAVTRIIKADPSTKDITVVAVTAHAMRGDETKAYEAGCAAYLAKPIDTRELPKMVSMFLA